jgi:MioC protein
LKPKVVILVATMSGTAELVADAVLEQLEKYGYEGRIVRMEKVQAERLTQGGVFLICTSTYGTGEVPDNAKPLVEQLQRSRPDLRRVSYGVFGLGDSIYPNTFCFGGATFDKLFESLGARRVGERRDHDSRSLTYPEDAAKEWAATWLEALAAEQTEED